MDKLERFAQEFVELAKGRQWAQAKYRYDTAMDVANFLEMTEKECTYLFGDRGERGVVLAPGRFPEETVVKVMEMVSVRGIAAGRGK